MLLVLINSCLIHESILSKILLDRILLACSTFDVLCGDNFLFLRGMMTQSPIFAIGSVAYDSVGCEHLHNSLVRIKMCNRFIKFFGGIHNDCINRVMTDFGLMDKYKVHDGLDQGEMFSLLLWHIFYDSLLCEVKRQVDGCEYNLNSYFISECGHAKSRAGLSSFFAVGVFVDNTIWVGSSRNAIQHIFNVASEFFDINDISINNDKTVAIFINCKVVDSSLLISGSPISIAKKEKLHCYLGIYLSTEGLSKPSLAKAHSNIWFFANLVLKKAVSDKQFSYLVLVVLFLIIGYKTQFSYISISVCKNLKSKSDLPYDFLSDTIHHLFLYSLKTFEQIQAENKLASVISFANSVGILGYLFSYWLHNLQVLCWCPLHLLQYPVCVKVNPLNNFLASMVCIFSGSDLSLSGFLTDVFRHQDGTLMFSVLGELTYFKCVFSLRHYGIVFFLPGLSFLFDFLVVCPLFLSSNILHFCGFSAVSANLLCFNVGCLSVYTDGSLSSLGSVNMKAETAVFFENIGMGLEMGVSGLMSSTLTKLQAIALALECVFLSHSINLFSDSQAALDACKLKLDLVCSDFRNQYWIEHYHIDVFQSVHYAHWEIGSGLQVIVNSLHADIDWFRSSLVWHLDSHMIAGFISKWTSGFRTYFIKGLHFQLPVAMHKQLYDKNYLSVVCLFYSDVKVLNHVFSCLFDADDHAHLLDSYASAWRVQSGLDCFFSVVSQLLFTCLSDVLVSTALYKSFVFKDWFHESVSVFKDSKVASQNIVAFVHEFSHVFWEDILLVCAKHHVFIEKNGLILCNRSVSISISGLPSMLSADMIELLGVAKAIGVGFGFQ
ncbi:hypothetical protein G9A89_023936 [Geosiphon pyriformis]|nr:hypothetical protein G9A89_023936 [Geosiphon pyriformis]